MSQQATRSARSKTILVAVVAALLTATAAQAVPVAIELDASSSVGVSYPSPTNFHSYSVTGTIFGDLTDTSFAITGGTLSLSGSGPDTEMTLIAGILSADVTGFFWDFGQGPFDAGVPAENPGYILNNSGATGTLGDMFGSVAIGGSFDAEGFGLAAGGSPTHSMTSFFWFSNDVSAVPEPGTATLLGLGLAGLGVRRRSRS